MRTYVDDLVNLLQMVSLLIGVVYFDQRLDQDGVMNVNGALFIFLTNMTFQNVFAVINVRMRWRRSGKGKGTRQKTDSHEIFPSRSSAQSYLYSCASIATECIERTCISSAKHWRRHPSS